MLMKPIRYLVVLVFFPLEILNAAVRDSTDEK